MRKSGMFLLALFLAATARAEAPFGQVVSTIDNPVPFGAWREKFRTDAGAQGVSPAVLDELFRDFTPDESIVAFDRRQPESKGRQSFPTYLAKVVSPQRIADGRRFYDQYRSEIDRIGAKYGVQPEFIVSLWGIETSYGRITGNYNVPRALVTLAYEGRRAEFFRGELIKSLRIVEQGGIPLSAMKGSWAGAMGQSQFMPSSYLDYAVDEDGDGRKDIWTTPSDVFGSIANYLAKSGWNRAHRWGVRVSLPAGTDPALSTDKTLRPAAYWSSLGIRPADGDRSATLPPSYLKVPGLPQDGAWLVFDNYRVVMKWNRSDYFATAVGLLADEMRR